MFKASYQTILQVGTLPPLPTPYYETSDFWIFFCLSVAGVVFSILSFVQASKAKRAAIEASTTVKLQTITIELTEIIQKLEKLPSNIEYYYARDLFNESSRRIRRLSAPFKDNSDYKETIEIIYRQLDNGLNALSKVRPDGKEVIVKFAVYNAVEEIFGKLTGSLSEFIGLIEKRTINSK